MHSVTITITSSSSHRRGSSTSGAETWHDLSMNATESQPRVDQLLPDFERDVVLEDFYVPGRDPLPDRPYLIVGMISSVDGGTALDHSAAGLGNATDQRALKAVRALGEAIIVGSTTVAADGYGPPSVPGQRVGVITRTGDLDYDTALFQSGAGFVIAPRSASIPSGIDVAWAGDEHLDIATGVRNLHTVVDGITTVIAEGGPTLNGFLFDADLVDELCVTTAALVIGGGSFRIINADGQHRRPLRLAHLLADEEGYLFARWIVDRG